VATEKSAMTASAADGGRPVQSAVERRRVAAQQNRRSRRSSREVRALLLDAAARVIGEKGLGASTREIATVAGVSENSLFRHFPTKSDLVVAAVIDPFVRFLETFREKWEAQRNSPLTDDTLIHLLVGDLYRNLKERRGLVTAFAMAAMDPSAAAMRDRVARALDSLFAVLRQIGEDRAGVGEGFDPTAVELTIRLHVAMITCSVIMADVFLPRDPRPDDTELINHIAEVNLYGVPRVPR
jgi:AcrR family transcriptional regulator